MQNTTLNTKIDRFIADNEQNILRDIGKLIAIDSVQTPAEPDAPFGKGCKDALDTTLAIADNLGLATHNCENYMGYAVLGESDPTAKHLATICHVDVVPVGEGWNTNPFEMVLRDGWLLGRGVADDKAPMILCLYALKFLLDEKTSLRYPIRALIGTNEETGMEDVDYYLAHYPAPAFCFTPDAEFPVCNGEKGHFYGVLQSKASEHARIVDFAGGVAVNAVPDRAKAVVRADMASLPTAEDITLCDMGDGTVELQGKGIAGHAAMPANTRNAIGVVVNYLLANGLCNETERVYLSALQKLHSGHDGVALGIASADEPFGALTIVGGVISMENGILRQTMDARYPTSTSGVAIEAQMRETLAPLADGVELVDCRAGDPFYISADSPAIQACIDTYNEVTGEQATPFTMGGGTYAKHFPYAVSFGPEREGMQLPEFGGPMHGANEAAPWDKLLEALKIYIVALLKLEEIDL